MKDRIRLLPESTANQIAAGEVVNRPSSVVKELLENAIDAGAGSVTVNIRDGGKGLIQIVDDGCGMSEIDARMAFDRHATSKISDVEDIYKLQTFGFRGEALASIASVAEVELRTRMHDAELGTKVVIHGGRFVSQEPVNCSVGTQLLIKNLFYNVPARRRFLEKSTTETRHIMSEFQRVALCYPEKAFSLYDSDVLLSKLSSANLKQRIVDVAGRSMTNNLIEVSAETSIVDIHGYIGRPEAAKKTNREQFLFVNGRFFKSPYFNKAVTSAYDKLIQAGTQPSYFIYLTVESERIDVNVHPQKTEVKFSDGVNMWQIINAAVRESLAKSGAVPAMDFDMDSSIEIPVHREGITYREPGITANPDFNPFERYSDGRDIQPFSAEREHPKASASPTGRSYIGMAASESSLGFEPGDAFSMGSMPGEEDYDNSVIEFIEGEAGKQTELVMDYQVTEKDIIRVGSRYILSGEGDGIRIVDTVRAAESLFYERCLAMLEHGGSATQQLLFHETLALSAADITLIEECAADLSDLGFEFSTNDSGITLTGIPADIDASEARRMIADVIAELHESETDTADFRRRRLAARLAGAAASGRCRRMQPQEAGEFVRQWETSGAGYTPSGLKVAVTLTEEQIKKLFEK